MLKYVLVAVIVYYLGCIATWCEDEAFAIYAILHIIAFALTVIVTCYGMSLIWNF